MTISSFELRVLAVYQLGFLFETELLTDIYASTGRSENTTRASHGGFFKFFDSGELFMPSDEFSSYSSLQKSILTSTVMYHTIGVLIGSAIAGSLAYRYGRKPVILFALTAGGVIMTLNAFVREFATLGVLRFLLGITIGLYMVCSWSLVSELIQPATRLPARAFAQYKNGRLLHAIVAFTTGNWRLSVLFSAVAAFSTASLYYWVPESPIWMANVGRTNECQRTLDELKMKHNYEIKVSTTQPARISLLGILRNRSFLLTLFVLSVLWLSAPYMNFTTELGNMHMEGVRFETHQILLPLFVSIVKAIVGTIQLNTRPFKRTHMMYVIYFSLLTITVGNIVLRTTDFIPSSSQPIINLISYLCTIALLAFCGDIGYLVTVEVVPTELRSTVLSFGSTISRMGDIIATLSAVELLRGNIWIQPATVAVLCIINLVICFFSLKNTQNVQLAEVPNVNDRSNIDKETKITTTAKEILT